MHITRFAILFAVFLTATGASAQEQRGSVDGIVRDSSGGILPGATVEAKNVGTGAILVATTDSTGEFRFPSVQIGTYDVTATLSGFRPQTIPAVLVALGQVKTLDFGLNVEGVTETVNVIAITPVIDITQSTRASL